MGEAFFPCLSTDYEFYSGFHVILKKTIYNPSQDLNPSLLIALWSRFHRPKMDNGLMQIEREAPVSILNIRTGFVLADLSADW